ncbi:MAG TPA: hypothetical protein VFZ77_11335 [Acidimicrobiales bacterium]
MLWFEREVVGALIDTPDQPRRSSIEAFVDGSLRDMPEHLRAGVAGVSLLLGACAAALRVAGRLERGDRDGLRRLLVAWEGSRIGVLRTYVRLMKSLVVFAENELVPADAA